MLRIIYNTNNNALKSVNYSKQFISAFTQKYHPQNNACYITTYMYIYVSSLCEYYELIFLS